MFSRPLSRLVTRAGGRRPVRQPPFWNNYGTSSDPSPKTCTPSTKVASAQQAPRRSAVRLRAAEKRMTPTTQKTRRRNQPRKRSEKRACSDTIEESSSVDEVDARRKLGIPKSPHVFASRTSSQTLLSISTSPLSERTVCVPTRRGTKSALPFISPSPAASGSNPGILMILADPRLCWLR